MGWIMDVNRDPYIVAYYTRPALEQQLYGWKKKTPLIGVTTKNNYIPIYKAIYRGYNSIYG